MATVNDLLQMQTTNLWCLPENYQVCIKSLGGAITRAHSVGDETESLTDLVC
jgi:hypothetical protein